FQEYTMNQLYLPMDFSDLIPEDHVARIVSGMIDALDDQLFFDAYKGGGRPAYHPKMMAKIVLYGYTQGLFSSRSIEGALREHLPMMWLAASQSPDFNTINRFRSERCKSLMGTLYAEMVRLLIEEGYVDGKDYFLDGTKIEANANKYTFVWRKSTDGYEEKLQAKIEDNLRAIEDAIEVDIESLKREDDTFQRERISREALEEVAEKVEQELQAQEDAIEAADTADEKRAKKQAAKPLRQFHRALTKDHLPRLQKYETQMGLFGERNSYSKTDVDATFMRMKDDHMMNGQLKAGYNVQAGTQDQFILHYSVHQSPTDARLLAPHWESLKETGRELPKHLIADAGYGSEPNYMYLTEQEGLHTLIPYNTYEQEQKRSFSKKTYHPHNWTYDEKDDLYWCPNQRKVTFRRYSRRTDKYGYRRDFKIYECESCEGCPFKADCTTAKGNRKIYYNPVYEELKAKEANKLKSKDGRTLYARRKTDVESVFGHVKQNLGYQRFLLRGLEKVHVEFGWVA
ncbi:IS1182 family transposase, partial [Alteribacillus sp. JSM 102045]|uniref:IS1182 family transposase n=1 Tax=Alteribacillus sp. JSM 102045 TaxID=1562101 RepID=UPI0035BF3F20